MEKQKIGMETVVCQAKEIVAVDMEGEKVMMILEQGKYYGLDSIGSCIWEMLDEPQSIQELINKLLVEYEVGEEECRKHVLEFINQLYCKGIVTLA